MAAVAPEEVKKLLPESEEADAPNSQQCSPCKCASICGCILLLLMVAYFGLAFCAANIFVQLATKIRTVRNDTGLWTPENITGHPFFQKVQNEMGSCASDSFLSEVLEFSKSNPWKLVNFPSRVGDAGQDVVKITAWWLPAHKASAPRIVLAHGYSRNFDSYYVHISAYFLRQLGFSVIAPSLRDHGLSESSKVQYATWGWAYPFDLLGAWDYAVHDPDGVLGGSLPSDQVGIMGFSMGGYVAATAFGLEEKVPGTWIDSGAFEMHDVLRQGMSKLAGDILAGLVSPAAYFLSNWISGVDTELNSPDTVLQRTSAAKRSVAVVHNAKDKTTPLSQADKFISIFQKKSESYELKEAWIEDFVCGEETHVQLQVWSPDVYRKKLCVFWSGVFGSDASQCKRNSWK